MLDFADRLGARDAGHRPLRPRRTHDGLLRARRRPGEGPDATCSPRSSPRRARAPALPARRADASPRSARSPAQAGLAVAEQARLAGPLLPRRHRPRDVPRPPRRPARAPGRHRRPRGRRPRPPPRRPRLHRRPAPRARRRRRDRAALRARDRRRARTRVTVGPARGARHAPTVRVRGPAPARTPDASTRCRLRYRSPARALPPRRRRAAASPSRSTAPRPGQTAVLLAGRRVVGCATIAREHDDSDEIRERFLAFFEARDHRRLPSASLVPVDLSTPRSCSRPRACTRSSPYFMGEEKPPHHRLTTVPEVLPHDGHRERRQHRRGT